MKILENRSFVMACCCMAVFFPGAFVFAFPGVMAGPWEQMFGVGKAGIGRLMFFVLAGTGASMYLCGKLLETIPPRRMILAGNTLCAACLCLAFGTMFTVSAPLVTQCFGLENFGTVFGLVFTAYGFLAGFLGPWLSGTILDLTHGNFTLVYTGFALFYLISAALITQVKRPEEMPAAGRCRALTDA